MLSFFCSILLEVLLFSNSSLNVVSESLKNYLYIYSYWIALFLCTFTRNAFEYSLLGQHNWYQLNLFWNLNGRENHVDKKDESSENAHCAQGQGSRSWWVDYGGLPSIVVARCSGGILLDHDASTSNKHECPQNENCQFLELKENIITLKCKL